jgi:hypothetical protein
MSEILSTFAPPVLYGIVGLMSLLQATYLLFLGQRHEANSWGGSLLRWTAFAGSLVFGIGCALQTRLLPVDLHTSVFVFGVGLSILALYAGIRIRALNSKSGSVLAVIDRSVVQQPMIDTMPVTYDAEDEYVYSAADLQDLQKVD